MKTRIQDNLFPHLQECFTDPLTEKQHELVMILETVKIEKYITPDVCRWMGRTPEDRRPIARAFVAKALYNLSTTRILIELLHTMSNLRMICGFIRKRDIPSESTFSRAFAEFARTDLGDKVHAALVEEHLKNQLIGHIARDATAIKGNEKPLKKEKKESVPKRRGRPKKTEVRELKEEKRLDQQMSQTPLESLQDIPRHCDVGTKKNAKGYKETWIGFKAHIDTADCGLPINVVLTSASLHDSQVAVPMMKMTSDRITYFYDLMDSAYDAKQIHGVSRLLGHIPIIDKNPRKGNIIPMAPAEALRYNERTAVERTNGRLKEEFGGSNVMVRGHAKVKLHILFGIITLFADQLLRLAL